MSNLNDIKFLEFWQFIGHEVGSARVKISSNAKNIHNLIDTANSDTKEFLRQAIKASYKRSRCHNLSSPIDLEAVLDILGETAYALRDNQRDDLFDIELLEEIAWHISQRYQHYFSSINMQSDLQKTNLKTNKGKAQVVSFPNYKIRQANTRL